MLTKDITYKELFTNFKKGLRNGNGRSIINGMLVEKLLGLVERLKETKGMRTFKFRFRRGFKRAAEMLEKGEDNYHRGERRVRRVLRLFQSLLRLSDAFAFSVCSAVKFKDLAISLKNSIVPGGDERMADTDLHRRRDLQVQK